MERSLTDEGAPYFKPHIDASSVGRIVHYCFTDRYDELVHRPAIIVRVWEPGDMVQLQVFTDGANDGPDFVSGVVWRTSVHYSEEPQHHTWHWPERS